MRDFIIIAGAPGVGKSTVTKLLQASLQAPHVDFGRLREFHLDREWKNESKAEEDMAFENAIFILKNYAKHGYKNVIIDDLIDEKIERIPVELSEYNYIIITFLMSDEALLGRRIVERNEGFTNVLRAQAWNRHVINRATLPNEYKIDRALDSPEQTFAKVLPLL